MPVYQLVLESKDRWENVDQGHRYNTALENRGGMVRRHGSGLEWTTLQDAREAARWLAGVYSREDNVRAVCVVPEHGPGGKVLLRANVK